MAARWWRGARLSRLALPALGGQVSTILAGFLATAVVGRLGTDELAGVAVATTAITVVSWCSLFLTRATLVDVARAGAADGGAERAAAVAVRTAALLGVTATALLIGVAGPLAHALSTDPDVAVHATSYLRLAALGMPGLLLGYAAHGVLQGGGRLGASLVTSIGTGVAQVAALVVLVPGAGLGVEGAAVAAAAGAWTSALVGLALVGRQVAVRSPAPAGAVRALLTEGGRQGVSTIAILSTVTGSTVVASRLGPTALAAHQIGLQVYVLIGAVVNAPAIAAQLLVAAALGGGATLEARAWRRAGLALCSATATVLAVAVVAGRGALLGAVTHDPAVTAAAGPVLVLVALQLLPGAVTYLSDATLLARRSARRLAVNNVVAALGCGAVVGVVAVADGLTVGTLWVGLVVWMVLRAGLNVQAEAAGLSRRCAAPTRVRRGR